MCVCVCVCVYYSVIKKKDIFPFVTTHVDLEGIKLSEISHPEKNKYCIMSFICVI